MQRIFDEGSPATTAVARALLPDSWTTSSARRSRRGAVALVRDVPDVTGFRHQVTIETPSSPGTRSGSGANSGDRDRPVLRAAQRPAVDFTVLALCRAVNGRSSTTGAGPLRGARQRGARPAGGMTSGDLTGPPAGWPAGPVWPGTAVRSQWSAGPSDQPVEDGRVMVRMRRDSVSPTTRHAGPSRPLPPGGPCWTPPANCSSSAGTRSRRSRTSPAAPGSPWTRCTRPSAASLPCCARSWRPRSQEAIRPCPPSSATTWRVSGTRRAPGRRSRRTSRPWSKSSLASPRSTWPSATPPPPTPTPPQPGGRSATGGPATCAHLPPTSAPPVSCAQTCLTTSSRTSSGA